MLSPCQCVLINDHFQIYIKGPVGKINVHIMLLYVHVFILSSIKCLYFANGQYFKLDTKVHRRCLIYCLNKNGGSCFSMKIKFGR